MNLCTDPDMLKLFLFLKIAFKLLFTILPIIVLIQCTIDIFKSVISTKVEETLKEGLAKNTKRLISALVVFLLPGIFTFIFTDLAPVDSGINQCFTNATSEKIEELEIIYKQEMEARRKAEKEANKKAAEKLAEEEKKKNEQIGELLDKYKDKNNSTGSSSEYSGTVTGVSNPNMTAKTFTGSKTIHYWELVPENISRKPALIVFLHGSGECGNINSMLHTGLPKFMNNGSLDNYDAIFIAPNTASCSWSSDATITKELIDNIVNEYNIDKKHIIITGHSLGGNGTWNMIAKYPDFFSAAVPVSGCPTSSNNSYLGIPIRSYVGQSESYYFSCNNAKVDGINEIGGNVELILVPSPNDTHGSVINIYGDSSVINWMLKQ